MISNINKNDTIDQLANVILNSKSILLIAHIAPDGDTLGSALALKQGFLQLQNVEIADIIVAGEVPTIYRFLPGSNTIKIPEDSSIKENYDLAIAVDVASYDRLGKSDMKFSSVPVTAVIDHHGTNPLFAQYNYVNPGASATGEMVYTLLKTLNITLNKDIATNVYTAILTDTGGFKFSNTSVNALSVCSKMIEEGAEPQYIYQHCYENRSLEMLKLHAYCVTNIKLSDDKKISWSVLTRKALNDINARDEHTDGIVELLRTLHTVEIAILFKETSDGNVKVSLRSKKYDVCSIARDFKGGGHTSAAGCTVRGAGLETVIKAVLSKARKLIADQ